MLIMSELWFELASVGLLTRALQPRVCLTLLSSHSPDSYCFPRPKVMSLPMTVQPIYLPCFPFVKLVTLRLSVLLTGSHASKEI